jgi:hypothetical protein
VLVLGSSLRVGDFLAFSCKIKENIHELRFWKIHVKFLNLQMGKLTAKLTVPSISPKLPGRERGCPLSYFQLMLNFTTQ